MPHAFRFLVPSLALLAGLAGEDKETITVTAEAEVPAPAVGTKTDTPAMLQPQASGSVDATLIREQDAIKLEDAIRNVAGVNVGGYYSDWDYYRIRGFDASATTQLDGLTATPGIWMNEEVYGLERIEVLKGPASMLYGQSVLGGLVNMVSKKPKLGSHGEGTLSGGTENFFEVGADAGTSLAEDAVGIRAVAMARNRGSWVDGVDDSRRWYVAPSLSWWIAETTTLTVLANIVDDDINAAWPLPAAGFVTSNPNGELPLDRNIGEPGTQNHVERTRASIGYEVAHRFSDMLELRQHARLSDYDSEFLGIYAGSLDPDQRTLNRDVYAYESTRLDVQIDTLLQADFATGSVPHTAVLGLDWRQGEETGFGEFAAIAPLDLFDPDYGAEPGALSAYTDTWIRELFPATAMAKP